MNGRNHNFNINHDFLLELLECSIISCKYVLLHKTPHRTFDSEKYKHFVSSFPCQIFCSWWSHPQNWWQQHTDPNRLFGGHYRHSVGHHNNHTMAAGLAEDDWESKIIIFNVNLNFINLSFKPAVHYLSIIWLLVIFCNKKSCITFTLSACGF